MPLTPTRQRASFWAVAAATTNVLQRVLAGLAGLAVVALVILVFMDATARTVANTPVRGTLEIVSYILLPVSVFGAYAYAHAKNQHMEMTLFVDRLKGTPSVVNSIAIEATTLVCVTLMLVYALYEAASSVALGEANVSLISVPIWPAKIFMCIGLAVFALVSLLKLLTHLRELPRRHGADGKAPAS